MVVVLNSPFSERDGSLQLSHISFNQPFHFPKLISPNFNSISTANIFKKFPSLEFNQLPFQLNFTYKHCYPFQTIPCAVTRNSHCLQLSTKHLQPQWSTPVSKATRWQEGVTGLGHVLPKESGRGDRPCAQVRLPLYRSVPFTFYMQLSKTRNRNTLKWPWSLTQGKHLKGKSSTYVSSHRILCHHKETLNNTLLPEPWEIFQNSFY